MGSACMLWDRILRLERASAFGEGHFFFFFFLYFFDLIYPCDDLLVDYGPPANLARELSTGASVGAGDELPFARAS